VNHEPGRPRGEGSGWIWPAVLGTIALACAIVWKLLGKPGTNYGPLSAPHRIPWALASWGLVFYGSLLAIVYSFFSPAGYRLKTLLLGIAAPALTAVLWKLFT
jgi:hypothetical protein